MGEQEPPSPLVFYDKLVFDGTAYIDTDYVIPSGSSLRVTLGNESNKSAQRVFLAGNSTDGYLGILYGNNTNSSTRQFLPYYDSTNYLFDNKRISISTYPTFDFFMTPYRCGHSDISWTYTKGNKHPNSILVLGMNTTHTGNPYSGIMGTFYVYGSDAQNVTTYSGFDSYTPVATFRPCTYLGEAGFWYVEENKFYGNTAGSGILTVSNN